MSISDLTQYIPHGLVAALGGIVTYVFRDHTQRDDTRFAKTFEILQQTNQKLDAALAKQSDNHAEILKILLQQKS